MTLAPPWVQNVGILLTLVGTVVGVVSFVVMVQQIKKAQESADRAASAAEQAVRNVGERLHLAATTELDATIKDLLAAARASDWARLLVRIDDARTRMMRLASSAHANEHGSELTNGIDDLNIIQRKVETMLANDGVPRLSDQNRKGLQGVHALASKLSAYVPGQRN